MKMIRSHVLLNAILLTGIAGPSAYPAMVIQGTAEANTGFFSANFMHGFDFVPSQSSLITDLGFWDSASDGLLGAFQVAVWDTTTQTQLASATIDNSDALDASVTVEGGQWRFETLGSPVAL